MAASAGYTRLLCWLLFLSFCATIASGDPKDVFTEELFIKPLSRGYVYSHFQFTTKWNASIHDSNTFRHYNLFPKALGEVLAKYGVQELHLSQTQGLWRHKFWGYPVHDAPPGAELWVWFKPTVKDIDRTWTELVNAVSGLFCSSLNFLDSKNTIVPRWSYRPQGVTVPGYSTFSYYVRYGALPREIVCTENLTPWKKLLPCDSKAGLSTLFNAFHFHDASYHSLGLHVRPVCADVDCTEEAIELSQSLSVVADVISTSQTGTPNWTLRSLFGNHLASTCPIAARSTISVEVTKNEDSHAYRVSPLPSSTEKITRGSDQHTYLVYDVQSFIKSGRALNIAATYSEPPVLLGLEPPPIHVHRYITGFGLDKGGISCLIYNTMGVNQSIIYLDVLPWFTRVFFNSLTVTNNGTSVHFKVHYVPGKDRSRPHHLELSFDLWPHSVTQVSFTFTRAFLKWTEYPPDANHGFYIGSATVTSILPTSRAYTATPQHSSCLESILTDKSTRFPVRVHTESLLVSLPTPDFSMPYNVICLACTVVAIAFGSVHNLTTRRFEKLDPSAKKGIIAKVKGFLSKLRPQKVSPNKETDNEEIQPEDNSSSDKKVECKDDECENNSAEVSS
ncbi:hypothetical protein BsWGS_16550 [Bradybaena similaris]